MKRTYLTPVVDTSAMETRTIYLDETFSFPVEPDPHGGWSDAKQREDDMADTTDTWSKGLW